MTFEKLNTDWNADPNAPDPNIETSGDTLTIDFYLNYFVYKQFKEGDKGTLTFFNCHKYYLGRPGDEGYYRGDHRLGFKLPWGEFYLVNDNWRADFPEKSVSLSNAADNSDLKHYIFFFRDQTFECIATDYKLKLADT